MIRSHVFSGSELSALCLALFGGLGCGHPSTGETDPQPTNKYAEGSKGQTILGIPGLGPQRAEYVIRNGQAWIAGDIVIPMGR
jgi:hypothetical protein